MKKLNNSTIGLYNYYNGIHTYREVGKIGYISIDNLYKNIEIMMYRECYAMEKIHGTSAHISFKEGKLTYFSGGEKHEKFIKLFDDEVLLDIFDEHYTNVDVVLFGEAYGGSQQGMSETYGKELKFVVFDVKIGENWLDVPNAEQVTKRLGLDFVDYKKIPTTMKAIDRERDRPSIQAKRNGIKENKMREGVVLRPLLETKKNNGQRVIVKHKRDEFMETKTKRVVDPAKLKVLQEAGEIAEEWVTPMRLTHVLDKLNNPTEMEKVRDVIKAMIEDVLREAKGEIIVAPAVCRAISKKTAIMFKESISKI